MGDQAAIVKQPSAAAAAVGLPSTTNLAPEVGTAAVPSGWSVLGPSWNAQVCPPGLEYLLTTSMLAVHQINKFLELCACSETNNRYEILDMYGRRISLAVEESHCCTRRDFTIHILNFQGLPCLKLERPTYCCRCSCQDGYNELIVSLPNGFVLGRVAEQCTCCSPLWFIYDQGNNRILEIEGPCNMCTCGDVEFPVYDMAKNQVGGIRKHWRGIMKEMFTLGDTFGVSFPLEMDPRWKTLILGALFLIHITIFEEGAQDGGHHSSN